MLAKNPGFTAVAVVTLALGIGANTAILSVVNAVLLRRLPYPEPDRLLIVREKSPQFKGMSVAYPNFLDWQRENRSFEGMAAVRNDDFNFTGAEEPERVHGEMVSAGFFSVLGVKPQLGRTFSAQEDRLGAAGVVLLSHGFWKRRFGADPSALGRTLTLNGKSYTVIGILPLDFGFREEADFFMPVGQWDEPMFHNRDVHEGLYVVGRLKPGVALEQARAEMALIAQALAKEYPKTNATQGTAVVPLKDDVVGYIRPTLLLLQGAVGFVLLIACANVANLLLARSRARRREFAIRAALGAGRFRVARQLLTESVLLGVAGGGLGLLLASWGTRLALAAVPDSVPRTEEIGLDMWLLAFTLAASVLTGILFGLVPAVQVLRNDPQESLKEGGRGTTGVRHRVQSVFVVSEMALALVLLVGAGLMIRSIWRLWQVDPGFDMRNLLTVQVALSPTTMGDGHKVKIAFDQLLERVKNIAGIQSAAMTLLVPLTDNDNEIPFWPGHGEAPPQEQKSWAVFYLVNQDYARTMRVPLLRGRFLAQHDTLSAPRVVVIDDVLARQLFAGEDPVDKQLTMDVLGSAQIVGVVGHVKQFGLADDDSAKIRNQIYFPISRVPDEFMKSAAVGINVVLRTTVNPLSVVSAVSSHVAGPGKDQPVYNVATMDRIVASSMAERRFSMLLLGIFAGVALLLAGVGIYGVISYSVGQRLHEIGIRMALGAEQRDVLKSVVRQGFELTFVGVAMGLVGALALTHLMSSLLYGVRPTDVTTFAVVSLTLTFVALAASYIPARRATKVDPMVALRYE